MNLLKRLGLGVRVSHSRVGSGARGFVLVSSGPAAAMVADIKIAFATVCYGDQVC